MELMLISPAMLGYFRDFNEAFLGLLKVKRRGTKICRVSLEDLLILSSNFI